MSAVVEVRDLTKRYGDTVAVDGISFEIERGGVFGMVGPNGAGKTTTIECVEGLRRPDRGSVRVLGLEPWRERRALNRRIGVQLQESGLPPRLRVREAMELFAALNPRSVDRGELLERLGLGDKRDAFFARLSGGQKQRLHIALALVNDPELVFLDEITTGLDPHARRAMWELVLDVRERGVTVFLSTHFMEEAERLCDRVAIVDRGKIVALDSPAALVGRHARGTRLTLVPERPADLVRLRALPGVAAAAARDGLLEVSGEGSEFVGEALRALSASGIGFRDVRTAHANLEDVFLALTGRRPEGEVGRAGESGLATRPAPQEGAAA